MHRMKRKGQIFTGIFTWVLVGTLILIAATTVVMIIYINAQKNTVVIVGPPDEDATANGTPIPEEPIANATSNPPEITKNVSENISENISIYNITQDTINTTHVSSYVNTTSLINASPENAELIPASCKWQLPYPDFTCTPGVIMTKNTTLICTSGYATLVRNVSQTTKDQVYAMYGVASHTTGDWEIDHLIPLSLGGSNDIRNLWPEPAAPYPGYFQKDRVEAYLYKMVCDGKLSLELAQQEIARNWVPYISTATATTTTPVSEDVSYDQIIG